jgi:hypothetical protein
MENASNAITEIRQQSYCRMLSIMARTKRQ